MKSSKAVTRELLVQLVVSPETSLPVSMRLRYEPSDPYVVHAAFTAAETDDPVEWVLGRDLLADGLLGPAGEGDVRAWTAGEHDRCDLYLLFSPPAGTALLRIPAQQLGVFLRETEAMVPRGSESESMDLDASLTFLLAGG
ncbi:SsgA family sporulation/cell division regulator [Streptomyces sp. NPDC000851]